MKLIVFGLVILIVGIALILMGIFTNKNNAQNNSSSNEEIDSYKSNFDENGKDQTIEAIKDDLFHSKPPAVKKETTNPQIETNTNLNSNIPSDEELKAELLASIDFEAGNNPNAEDLEIADTDIVIPVSQAENMNGPIEAPEYVDSLNENEPSNEKSDPPADISKSNNNTPDEVETNEPENNENNDDDLTDLIPQIDPHNDIEKINKDDYLNVNKINE